MAREEQARGRKKRRVMPFHFPAQSLPCPCCPSSVNHLCWAVFLVGYSMWHEAIYQATFNKSPCIRPRESSLEAPKPGTVPKLCYTNVTTKTVLYHACHQAGPGVLLPGPSSHCSETRISSLVSSGVGGRMDPILGRRGYWGRQLSKGVQKKEQSMASVHCVTMVRPLSLLSVAAVQGLTN